MDPIIQHIEQELNEPVTQYTALKGGDINDCFCLSTMEARYFLKVNDAVRYPGMFQREAAGLSALQHTSNLVVPKVVRQGTVSGKQWLLLQFLEKEPANPGALQQFGRGLANMHKRKQPFFGWPTDNFIGSLNQLNTAQDSWAVFYAQCRILPLVSTLFNSNDFTRQDIKQAEILCKRLEDMVPPEPPALLHGDLWPGNYMIVAGGAAIFDPAVYYGHREMDIGMSKLFGGFSDAFYAAYEEEYPMEKGWVQRLPITQLYPLLVHARLFGGHYIDTCSKLLKELS